MATTCGNSGGIDLEDVTLAGLPDGNRYHRRRGLVLHPRQGHRVDDPRSVQDLRERHLLERPVHLDEGLRRRRVLSRRDDLDVADRVKADGQQQGEVVVCRGLDRASRTAQPAALA